MFGIIFSPMTRIALGALLLVGAYFTGHWRGVAEAEDRCQKDAVIARALAAQAAAEAQAQAIRRDLDAAEAAATRAREAEAANRAAADEATRRIAEYEEALRARPNPACSLDADDVDRLRQHPGNGLAPGHPAPPRRGDGHPRPGASTRPQGR